MNITVLGCYGPCPRAGGATSSYLLRADDTNIALDFGAGALSRLLQIEKPENLDAIILSHLHFDHISDMGVLTYYFQLLFNSGYQKPLTVFMPDDEANDIFEICQSPYFKVVKIKEDEEFTVGSLALKFYKMRHPVLSYGVRATNGEKTFAYTGDTNTHENLLSIFDGADLVLADGAFLLKDWAENKPHLSVSHISELTKKCGNRSIITHLSAKYTLDELIGEVGDVDCQIASEGKCYEI